MLLNFICEHWFLNGLLINHCWSMISFRWIIYFVYNYFILIFYQSIIDKITYLLCNHLKAHRSFKMFENHFYLMLNYGCFRKFKIVYMLDWILLDWFAKVEISILFFWIVFLNLFLCPDILPCILKELFLLKSLWYSLNSTTN